MFFLDLPARHTPSTPTEKSLFFGRAFFRLLMVKRKQGQLRAVRRFR